MSTQRAKHSRTRSAAQVSSSTGAGRSDTSVLASRPTGMPSTEKNSVTVKACITDTMDDDLRKFARENGFGSTSDCIREVLRLALYGPDHVLDLHRARIEALARNLVGSRP